MILHSDMNSFYASVECLYNPKIRRLPVVVAGDVDNRKGIVLAKNQIAKQFNIRTGEVIWQAQQKCNKLVVVPPNYNKYLKFSRLAREIYGRYTSQIESFGLDECWLDVTGSNNLFGDGYKIAQDISRTIKRELGVTVSIGVSWNKIFAKLGSDMKKPDAITCVSKSNFKSTAWKLDVGDLLYVGKSTKNKLNRIGIKTIGDLATFDIELIHKFLGKWGLTLSTFAKGNDVSLVDNIGTEEQIKSIGNSTTTPFDVYKDEDIKTILYILSESVASRLRELGQKCTTIQISVKDNNLHGFERQGKLLSPTFLSNEIFELAYSLYQNNKTNTPIRSLGVRGCNLVRAFNNQICFFEDEQKRIELEKIERTVDWLQNRFGYYKIRRGLYIDNPLSYFNPKGDHVIFPVSFFK